MEGQGETLRPTEGGVAECRRTSKRHVEIEEPTGEHPKSSQNLFLSYFKIITYKFKV